jgi:hypothetical protein
MHTEKKTCKQTGRDASKLRTQTTTETPAQKGCRQQQGCQHSRDAGNNRNASTKGAQAITGTPAQKGRRQQQKRNHKRDASDNRNSSNHRSVSRRTNVKNSRNAYNSRDANNSRKASNSGGAMAGVALVTVWAPPTGVEYKKLQRWQQKRRQQQG